MTKKYRVLYMLEKYTDDGALIYRYFARNKRLADKIERDHGKADMRRKLTPSEMVTVGAWY